MPVSFGLPLNTPRSSKLSMFDRQLIFELQKQRDDEDRRWRERQEKSNRRWRVAEIIVIGVMIPLGAAILQREDVIEFRKQAAATSMAKPQTDLPSPSRKVLPSTTDAP